MHKNLLYLYNDGHNPFPHLGKGGLGYKLPQYRLHGKGKSHPQDSDEEYEYTEGEEEVQEMSSEEKDAREIYNDFTNPNGEYYNLSKNDKLIELSSAIAYLNGNEELQKPFLDLMNELKRTSDGSDLFYIDDKGFVEVNKDYDYDLDGLRPTNEIEIDISEASHFYNSSPYFYFKNLKDSLNNLIKESRTSEETKILKNKLQNVKLLESELKDLKIYNEKDLRKYLRSKNSLSIEEKELFKMYDLHDKDLQDIETENLRIETLVKDIQSMTFDKQIKLIKDEYSNILGYYKTRQESSGKGYEEFLCNAGSCIIKDVIGDDKLEVINLDNSPLVPKTKQKYCAVDLLYVNPDTKKGGIIEAKDFSNKDMLDRSEKGYTAIQASKICGNPDFDIIYGKDNGEYYIIDVRYRNKPITNDIDINEYLISVNAKEQTWICDLLQQKKFIKKYINDKTMVQNKQDPRFYKVDINEIPFTEDEISGAKTQSVRIKNKYFNSK
jgi:hypothetical protein